MAAFFLTIVAIILNLIWFSRHGISVGQLVAHSWPAVLGLTVFLAFVLAISWVSVQWLNRRDEKGDD